MNELTIEKRQFHNFDTSKNGTSNFGHLVVPAYQRRYEWREDNIDMVKDELLEKAYEMRAKFKTFKNDEGNLDNILKPYASKLIGQNIYFGNIVITLNLNDSFPDSVVDGQQRLSTFALFLKYFELIKPELERSNIYSENKKAFTPLLNKIKKALYYQTEDGEDMNFISSENEYDKKYLDDVFKIKSLDEIDAKTKNTYISNMKLIKSKLADADSELKLFILLALMTSEFGITSVIGEERAYELFEALNSRSLQLSPSDLIKNHVFKLTAHNSEFDAKEKWDEFTSNVSINDEAKTSEITSFIRAYIIQDRKIYIKKKELFKVFKNYVAKETIGSNFNKLISAAKVYTQAITGTFKHDDEIDVYQKKSFLSVMPQIYTPIVIYGELNFDNELNYKIQEYLFKQSTLHFSINNLPSKELDKNVIDVLKEINDNSSWEDIKESFDKNLMSETINNIDTYDKRVERLLNKKFDNRKVLLALYKYMKSTEKTEYRKIYKSGTLDLEHILPQTPSKWVGSGKYFDSKEDADKYISLIGNTLFINASINRTIKNNEYEIKLKDKEFSEANINGEKIKQSLSDSILFQEEMKDTFNEIPSEWTKTQIDERTMHIVNLIKSKKILLP